MTNELVHPIGLKQLLIDAARSSNNSIPSGIQEIDLGNFAREGDLLMAQTLGDPQHQERVSGVYALPDSRVIIDVNPTISQKIDTGLWATYFIKVNTIATGNDNLVAKDKLLSGVIHTHGVFEQPQSPDDLFPLFLSKMDNGAVMSGVFTPCRRIFVFRGEDTPTWNQDYINTKVRDWTKAHINRVKQHISILTPRDVIDDINRRVATALLNQIAQKYKLLLYSGSNTSSTLTAGPVK